MRLMWEKADSTGYVTSVTWAGSAKQAARSVTFSVAYSPYDDNVETLDIKNGDQIVFYPGYPDDKTTKFVGMVTERERKNEAGTLQYTAKDGMIHLLRSSGTYKFQNKTAETIAAMVAKDVKVSVGNLVKTKVNIPSIFFSNRPYYEIIMAGYTKAHQKNGKQYIAQMNGSKLDVIEKGKLIGEFHLVQGERILTSSYRENVDSMVNRVYIYDSSNKKIGEVSNATWIKDYGVFQNSMSVDSGNGKTEAKSQLTGIEKTASLTAIGDIRCVSGLCVGIRDDLSGIVGRHWIESDSHTWENGSYTMSLELAFKNEMDMYEGDTEQTASTGNGTINGDGTTTSSALDDVLNEARSWIGTGEDPPGSNHNAITEYYGMNAAWCCMFIWTIFNKSGHGDLFMGGGKTAYCFDVMDWYKARGKWGSSPQVGALVIYGGSGHIGIVESVSGSSYVSIEGNLSDSVKRSNGPSCSVVLGFCYPDYPVTTVTNSVGSMFTAYALSEDQLRGLARLCQQEQGSVDGAKAEASLMANLFEKRGSSYGSGANGLYNYVRNSGWFARASYWMSQTGSLDGSILEGVRSVLINGNRTLPTYVDEHDWIGDISSATNNGVAINPSNRSQYQQDVTVIRNVYGSTYTFYCFPASNSDPFGYTSR